MPYNQLIISQVVSAIDALQLHSKKYALCYINKAISIDSTNNILYQMKYFILNQNLSMSRVELNHLKQQIFIVN